MQWNKDFQMLVYLYVWIRLPKAELRNHAGIITNYYYYYHHHHHYHHYHNHRAAAIEMPRPTVRKWCEHGYNTAFTKTMKGIIIIIIIIIIITLL
jgi:hypothetical protein